MIYDLITVGRGNMTVGGSLTNIAIRPRRLGLTSITLASRSPSRKPGKLTSLAPVGEQPSNHFPLSFYRKDPAELHLTVEEAEYLPSSETRALLLSGNAFSRGASVKAATFCTEAGHRAGLSTSVEPDLRPSERLQPGSYGPPR